MNERKHLKFVNKVGRNLFTACPHCQHLNFKRYKACLKCGGKIVPEEEDEEATFLDTERASGPAESDPLQIGLVKFSYKLDTITEMLELNIKTEARIDKFCSEKIHGIRKINGTLYKNGKKLENGVTQKEAIEKFEKFISDSKVLICHDIVDFVTYENLIKKHNISTPNYSRVKKVDSQNYFKKLLRKFGMRGIVEEFGDRELQRKYSSKAHGALFDAEALCQISTGRKLKVNFKEFLFDRENFQVDNRLRAVNPSRSRSVSFMPG